MRSSSSCRTTARRSAADDDSMLRKIGTGTEIWDSLWGHGTSVMSPNQYHVAARDARIRARDACRARPGTATGRSRSRTCGRRSRNSPPGTRRKASTDVSLLPYLEGVRVARDARRHAFDSRKPTSTRRRRWLAVTTPPACVNEAAVLLRTRPDSGWVQLRADSLPELFARKQRAAHSRSAPCWRPFPGLRTSPCATC